ncbi:MAG: asparagine synthetase B [Acidobacteria bacterium]|nr:asparagine synthetase B [Acidobacteriota bacterium]
MSGIVGICHSDGRPVDSQLLQRMTDYLAFCGPDAQNFEVFDNVGFGHALLQTTEESLHERQPFSLDGQVWITADARIDARSDLIPRLHSGGQCVEKTATDAELILRAYELWGECCVEHLLGDFAFAIWDKRRRQLFCARDHFGIKPFFYAHIGNQFVFSNTLNCVRLHPWVSTELNEQAIGDFLLFDSNQDLRTTVFAEIQRLPPAHTLTYQAGEIRLRRYWSLPDGDLIRYRRSQDVIDEFLDLLRAAVSDRLRTNRVSVQMSGGLDSAAVAAIAKELLAERSGAFQMEAHTAVYDRLFPDQERYYAGLVAEKLKIPIHFFVADDYLPYAGWNEAEFQQPEPENNPFLNHYLDLTRQCGERHRVILTGSDGDTFFFELPNWYFNDLFRRRKLGRLLFELARYSWTQREFPRIGLRAWIRRRRGIRAESEFPAWLNPDFASRLNLPERWQEYNREQPQHPVRPRIYRVLNDPMWSQHFEGCNEGLCRMPIEYRHPLADLRLLEFSLSLPPVPWLLKKELLRAAMRGILPKSVCLRPKSPLTSSPFIESLRNPHTHWIDKFSPEPLLANFVNRDAVPPCVGEVDDYRLWVNARPLSLNFWLAALTLAGQSSHQENKNGVESVSCFGQSQST